MKMFRLTTRKFKLLRHLPRKGGEASLVNIERREEATSSLIVIVSVFMLP